MTTYKSPKELQIPEEMFKWPIVTKEDEDAVLDILRRGAMSGTETTTKFEKQFAEWIGTDYAVACANGTMSLEAAMFACGLGEGDHLICQSKTYWASCMQAYKLGAAVIFCDIDKNTLCMDPDDLEKRITPQTKAIMVVHYLSMPADMDRICAIAKKHNLMLIEDVSHAQGGKYKGKKLGTFGDCAAMSLMTGKSFATGEMGILVTNNRHIYERALAYTHHEFNNPNYITDPAFAPYFNVPLGCCKGRVNQMCSAMGLVQLKYYDQRCAEMRQAMDYFVDLIKDIDCVQTIVANKEEGSDNAGFYETHAIYHPEKNGGMSLRAFCDALKEQGFPAIPGGNSALHTHPYFIESNARLGVGSFVGQLPVTESIRVFSLPWFKKFRPEYIKPYADALHYVVEHREQYMDGNNLADDKGAGRLYFNNPKK